MKPLTNFVVNPTPFSNAMGQYHLVEAQFGPDPECKVEVATFPFEEEPYKSQAQTMAGQFAYMMNVMGSLNQVFPPVLDDWKDGVPHAERRLEQAIVANLIHHLGQAGFHPVYVDDGGDEMEKVNTMKETLDAVFAVDESRVHFMSLEHKKSHPVLLVCGNGVDIICDWSYHKDDIDGFNKAMEAFEAESIKSL